MDSTIGSKMTLVNIVPQVVLHQKMHLLETDNFLGGGKIFFHKLSTTVVNV